MAIVLGIASVLIVIMTVLAIRVLLYAGVFVLFLVWLQLIVIGIISAGVGAIVFALLYQVLGAGNAGFVWAGALAVGLMVGWGLLMGFADKVVGGGRKLSRKKNGFHSQS
jgi:hypothetical protein